MAIETKVNAELREGRGKGPARQLRMAGKIPAVLYGAGGEAVSLALVPKSMGAILRAQAGHNTIFELSVTGGETIAAMIVDWQRDPIKGQLLHVDLKRIAMDRRLRVKVPVHAEGEAAGVKTMGGILDVVTREIELECLPGDIPEFVVVDVSALTLNQSIRAGELQLPATLQLITDADRVIVHVVAVKEEVVAPVAEVAAATTAAEPEVIKKGKGETEEAPVEEGKKEKKK